MNNIIDPVNGNSYDIFSFEGKNLLKNYVKAFQNGGTRKYDFTEDQLAEIREEDEIKRRINMHFNKPQQTYTKGVSTEEIGINEDGSASDTNSTLINILYKEPIY